MMSYSFFGTTSETHQSSEMKSSSDWKNINNFSVPRLNLWLMVDLKKYIAKHGAQQPSTFWFVNKLASCAGMKIMQEYARQALEIAERYAQAIVTHNIHKKDECCMYIFSALEELLRLYDPTSTEVSGYIKNAFEHFAGFDPATVANLKVEERLEKFEEVKSKVFKHHDIPLVQEKGFYVVTKPYFLT